MFRTASRLRPRHAIRAAALCALLVPEPLPAARLLGSAPVARAITSASLRFGIPRGWIEAVIAVESGGNPAAISSAGALGLMQVMPATYAGLRQRHGLGADPFHIFDNVLAGTAYLRELFDRYGARGMLAAYNAGPGRWEAYLLRGRPLPPETIRYLARLAPRLGFAAPEAPLADAAAPISLPPRDRLFVAVATAPAPGPRNEPAPDLPARGPWDGPSKDGAPARPPIATPRSGGLFVVRPSSEAGQ